MRCRSLKACLLALLSTLLLGVLLALYGYGIERHWVEETHWKLRAENWKGRPLRLAVIADLHARPGDGEYLDALVRQTLNTRPDVVLLLGDYVGGDGNPMELRSLGSHLAPLMQVPCFAVMGNHDEAYGLRSLKVMLEDIGATLTEGELHALPVGGDTLYLAGITCTFWYSKPGRVVAPPPGSTCLLLSHSPAGGLHAPAGITATLAAHTHGGQVCLPGGVPLARQDAGLKWWEMQGRTEKKGIPLFITRGLGTTQAPIRLFCRPEIMVVELSKG